VVAEKCVRERKLNDFRRTHPACNEREARVKMFRVNSMLNIGKVFKRALHAFARKMRALQLLIRIFLLILKAVQSNFLPSTRIRWYQEN
jgi:hypothetical protein